MGWQAVKGLAGHSSNGSKDGEMVEKAAVLAGSVKQSPCARSPAELSPALLVDCWDEAQPGRSVSSQGLELQPDPSLVLGTNQGKDFRKLLEVPSPTLIFLSTFLQDKI